MSKADTSASLVSVVIPTFNRKKLLVEAVQSCIDQSWPNIEIIVVDDGSTDGTGCFLKEMTLTTWKNNQIIYLVQENSGASSARNYGVRIAHGDYIQFLDSDDMIYPTKIARQVVELEQAERHKAVCCYCYGCMGLNVGDLHRSFLERIGYCATDPKELVRVLCSRQVHVMQTAAPLWRRRFLMNNKGWREDISLGDDLEFYIRLLVDADAICFIDEELFFVREHPNSRLSADPMSASSLASLVRTRQAVFNTLLQSGLWDAQNQRAFLGAMRTIYANALQLGNTETIRDLESWLRKLVIFPKRIPEFQALILMRQIFGRQFLLGIHKLIKKILPT